MESPLIDIGRHTVYVWVGFTLASLWVGNVLRRQMLCHMSSLLDSMKGARHALLHLATTYGVQRVAYRAAGGCCGQTHTAVTSIWPPGPGFHPWDIRSGYWLDWPERLQWIWNGKLQITHLLQKLFCERGVRGRVMKQSSAVRSYSRLISWTQKMCYRWTVREGGRSYLLIHQLSTYQWSWAQVSSSLALCVGYLFIFRKYCMKWPF